MITSPDELRYEGMVFYADSATKFNFTNYLKFNSWYWTMSAYAFSSSIAYEYLVGPYGYFDDASVNNLRGFRTSVSLKSNTLVSSGTGTYDDPYVIN